MQWPVFMPDAAFNIQDVWDFMVFLNAMASRWFQGNCRYGSPNRKKKYMTRLRLELEAYEKTGNKEHLFNIANYAYLESYKPENRKFHLNNRVDSVTRGKV